MSGLLSVRGGAPPSSALSPQPSSGPRRALAAAIKHDADQRVPAADDASPPPVVLKAGDQAWIPCDRECYRRVTVRSVDIKAAVAAVYDAEYKVATVALKDALSANDVASDGVEDSTALTHLNEAALLQNLRSRYLDGDRIYTYTASILVAVNPYKEISGYGSDQMRRYCGVSLGRLPPHVYAIGDSAYRRMCAQKEDQSVLCTGESGAGKTETCKHLLRYLAFAAESTQRQSPAQPQPSQQPLSAGASLEARLLAANPVLEAFGNAKTLRNNNSSRFGKYSEVHFDRTGAIAGASLETYLLEKCRVTMAADGERTFHIFYQLIAGAAASEKEEYALGSPDEFKYLSRSQCTGVAGVNDAMEYASVCASLDAVGVPKEIQSHVFRVVAAILHLGNVSFVNRRGKTVEGAVIDESDALCTAAVSHAARLLGMAESALRSSLVSRTLVAGGGGGGAVERYEIPLSVAQAVAARDSFARHMYGLCFEWLVGRIRDSLRGETRVSGRIGILDISGFEVFETNRFEQFCINSANERIQQHFNAEILRQEQLIYELEGLRWKKIPYDDNSSIIDLLENKRTGIMAIIDEECLVPKATDRTVALKIHTMHGANQHLSKPKPVSRRARTTSVSLVDSEAFVVRHFAGEVTYSTDGFLERNNDALQEDLLALLDGSTDTFVSRLASIGRAGNSVASLASATSASGYGATLSVGGDADTRRRLSSGAGQPRVRTVVGVFQRQLQDLMDRLTQTHSHFVRCIKPNQAQQPDAFEGLEVMAQLRYAGMCTALLLMQKGYPTRCSFDELHARYSSLMPASIAHLRKATFCEALLVALDLHGGRDFQMGLSKVFFRAGRLAFLEELLSGSREQMESVVGRVRVWLARKRFRAAFFALRAARRFVPLLLKVRRIRRFRRAVCVYVRVLHVFRASVERARGRLVTDTATRERRAVEAMSRANAEALERHLREEAERIRIEQKAERRRQKLDAQHRLEARCAAAEAERAVLLTKLSDLEAQCAAAHQESHEQRQATLEAQAAAEQLRGEAATLGRRLDAAEASRDAAQAEAAAADTVRAGAQAAADEAVRMARAEAAAKDASERALAAELAARRALEATVGDLRQTVEAEAVDKESTWAQLASASSRLSAAEVALQSRDAALESLRASLESAQAALAETTARASAAEDASRTIRKSLDAALEEARRTVAAEVSAKELTVASLENCRLRLQESEGHSARQQDAANARIAELEQRIRALEAELRQLERANALLAEGSVQTASALAAEKTATAEARERLRAEYAARTSDAEGFRAQLDEIRKHHAAAVWSRDAAAEKTRRELRALQAETAALRQTFAATEANLADALDTIEHSEAHVMRLSEALREAEDAAGDASSRIRELEKDHASLVPIAVKCYEAQLRLKNIYSKYPKAADLAKVVFGDLGYNNVSRNATKVGVLLKLGGLNLDKFQERHIVLNDSFVFYYGAAGAWWPKGLWRVDQGRAEVLDAPFLGQPHAFRITVSDADGNTREYILAASNDMERDDWVEAIHDTGSALQLL